MQIFEIKVQLLEFSLYFCTTKEPEKNMIQEIKIKNFLSFKDEVIFSFEATNDKFAEESQVVTINENTRLLRFAIIYGYNASGKSNLLGVLDFLSYFWSVKPKDMDSKTGVIPFKLDSKSANEPSSIELVFFARETKYWYQLVLDQQQVYLEKLSYYKTTQPIMLFERTLKNGQSNIQFNPKAERVSNAAKDMISVNCLKNTSFFVARNQVNVSLPIIDAAKEWMRKQLMPLISPTTGLTSFAQKKASENRSLINYIVKFLHEADFNVTDVSANVISKQLTDDAVKYLGRDFVYSDTDSVYFRGDHDLSEINARIYSDAERMGATAAEPGGKIHHIGVWELDGKYKSFRVLGAKCYAMIDYDGNLKVTVAGVPKGNKETKTKGAYELARNGGLDAFREGFTFSEGITIAQYHDYKNAFYREYNGRKLLITSNVSILPSTHIIGASRSQEYIDVLHDVLKWLKSSGNYDRIIAGDFYPKTLERRQDEGWRI